MIDCLKSDKSDVWKLIDYSTFFQLSIFHIRSFGLMKGPLHSTEDQLQRCTIPPIQKNAAMIKLLAKFGSYWRFISITRRLYLKQQPCEASILNIFLRERREKDAFIQFTLYIDQLVTDQLYVFPQFINISRFSLNRLLCLCTDHDASSSTGRELQRPHAISMSNDHLIIFDESVVNNLLCLVSEIHLKCLH